MSLATEESKVEVMRRLASLAKVNDRYANARDSYFHAQLRDAFQDAIVILRDTWKPRTKEPGENF